MVSTVPATSRGNRLISSQRQEADLGDVFLRAFGEDVGKRVGTAVAKEIRDNPEARRASAIGAGVGIGVVIGLSLLGLADQ